MAMTGMSDVVGWVIDGEAVPQDPVRASRCRDWRLSASELIGHIRTTWDLELIQVCSDGAVVYADGLGHGSQRPACPVLRSDDVDGRQGFESRLVSS